MNRFSVIGAGNVGLNLISSLQKKGFVLSHIFKKTAGNHFASHLTADVARLVADSDFVFIAVQESRIRAAAQFISEHAAPQGKVFFHTANSLTSDELRPLQKAGAHVASFSPLQTFIHFCQEDELFSGSSFLLEGNPAAVRLARRIAAKLHARVLLVDKRDKMYFHMAAIAAANFLIANLKFADRQLQKTAGRPGLEILFPLLDQTLSNVKKYGWQEALSGPLQRSESWLLVKHCRMLAGIERKYYRMLLAYLREKPFPET
jgi:predicted short-subunit dehydrogenase-like oxidoreductase (DUF2520 family)